MTVRTLGLYKKVKLTFPNAALMTLAINLERELKDCSSILDLGCGSNSPLKYIKARHLMVGVDGHRPSINKSRGQGIHNKYYVLNILNIDKKLKAKSFDAVVALDVIEHLKKNDGKKFLSMMEKLARKKVILLTPNGFLSQHDPENNLQEHLSGWSVSDFGRRGYKVKGLYGWKPLRIEEASLRFRPKVIWGIISELTHYLYTQRNPKKSFSLFVVKSFG